MKLEHEIKLNKFGQYLIIIDDLIDLFKGLSENEKNIFFNDFLFMIIQNKPTQEDVEKAINISKLKESYTPCVILKKGINQNSLRKVIELPNNEEMKSFKLLSFIYRIAYNRRFKLEKNNPDKWWYWDLSDDLNLTKIQIMYG